MSRPPLAFPLLCDENIRREVVEGLAAQGRDVRTVHDEGLTGQSDLAILERAHDTGRVVLTHDTDFGRLAVHTGVPIVCVICVRPGHISPHFVLETLAALNAAEHTLDPPFVIVAERRADIVRVRVRRP